jgi:Transposase zinc-ribbon domain
MKHLIPYLQDDQKAADYLRQVRWPDGVTCPRCGSDAVEGAFGGFLRPIGDPPL